MLKEQVIKTLKKYNQIESGDKIILGVSGGPDSISMLNILNEIRKEKNGLDFEIIVAHINHMIREEATEDEEYVRSYCEKENIKFYAKRVPILKISQEHKIGTEEAGRKIRYDFFEEILKKENANKIATAHNANDNAETILMNILRGTSPSGIKGIEPIRENKYIRPLIECKREDIEEYCKKENLNPRIDKTNYENIYTRNKIRNILIPLIEKEFNPNIIETLNRLSEIAKIEDIYFEEIIEEKYREIAELNDFNQEKKIILDLEKFNKENIVIKNRLILYTINKLVGSTKGIEKIHIDDIIKLCEKNIGNKFLQPKKHIKILIKNKKIIFMLNA